MVHRNDAERVSRYLPRTSLHGIMIGNVSKIKMKRDKVVSELLSYIESDLAGKILSRESTGDNIKMPNGGFICWHSFKQRCVAVSSTDSEYVTLSECLQKVRYHRRI